MNGLRSSAGYSGTPLFKKLGIKDGSRVLIVGAPTGFSLGELPVGATVATKVPARTGRARFDVALVFVRERRKLEAAFLSIAGSGALEQSGGLWGAWPKKSSGELTDITEGVLREVILRENESAGYVDNKVCAIDATWSGLRFVLRKENRAH